MKIQYQYKNLNRKMKDECLIYELLNAIGILEYMDWKDSYRIYVDTLKIHANGPSEDQKNEKAILKECGYSYSYDLSNFKNSALLKRGNHFYALKKEGNDIFQYGLYDPVYLDEFDEYEMYIKDYHYNYKNSIYYGHDASLNKNYSYQNLNPKGKYVGDCTIRALAQVLHCRWIESLDILSAQAFKMNVFYMNSREVMEKVLEKYEFKKYKHFPYKLNLFDFCSKMDETYKDAEILVYAGNNHITSLKKENNQYRIQDTWDCSQELAGDYFVKEKKKEEIKNLEGCLILHPIFKEGIVVEQKGNKCTVSFDQEDKILMLEWIVENCTLLE